MAAAASELLTGWCLFGLALLVRGGSPGARPARCLPHSHSPARPRAGGIPPFPCGAPSWAGCPYFLGPSLFQLRASRLASSFGPCPRPARQPARRFSSCRGGAAGPSRARSRGCPALCLFVVCPARCVSTALVPLAVLSEGTKSELCVVSVTLMFRGQIKSLLKFC